MAKQGGILGLRGKIGGMVFASDGSVRQAPASRPVTATRTLENNAEFGSAASFGKRVRDAFRGLLANINGTNLTGRMTQVIRRVIGADTVNDRGLRQVLGENIAQLIGFNFSDTSLSSTMYAPYLAAYGAGADANKMTLAIPSLVPNRDLAAPQGATHYRLIAQSAQIDTLTGEVELSTQTLPAAGPIDGLDDAPGNLDLAFVAAPGADVVTITAVGVEFYQQVNGQLYPLENRASNALTIVSAE